MTSVPAAPAVFEAQRAVPYEFDAMRTRLPSALLLSQSEVRAPEVQSCAPSFETTSAPSLARTAAVNRPSAEVRPSPPRSRPWLGAGRAVRAAGKAGAGLDCHVFVCQVARPSLLR